MNYFETLFGLKRKYQPTTVEELKYKLEHSSERLKYKEMKETTKNEKGGDKYGINR